MDGLERRIPELLQANKPKMNSDILLTIGILVAWSGITAYVMGKLYMRAYRNNWDEVKCQPHVIPFAGEIMQPIHQGDPDVFTQQNLTACSQEISKKVTEEATKHMNDSMNKVFGAMQDSQSLVDGITDDIKEQGTAMADLLAKAVQWMNNIRTEINRIIYVIRDTFGKFTAIVTTVFFSLITFYRTAKSALGAMLGDIVKTLYVMIALIIVAMAIPFVGWAKATALGVVATGLASTAATMIVATNMLQLNSPAIPSFCFSPDTIVSVNGGIEKEMCDVCLGDVLDGTGAVVRGTLRLNNMDTLGNQREDMYMFDNGAVVSGPHLIFDETLDRFVTVSDYATTHDSVERSHDVCPELVCLITSNHTIPIGKYTFHDWEDAGVESMVYGAES
jgi:preprotein translocase subunit SecE